MKTVLIADDSPSIRKLLETILISEGYRVLSAKDGREALRSAFDNDIDVIVADEMMPGLSGSGFFKILNTDPEKRSIPRIMISGITTPDDRSVSDLVDVFISKNGDVRSQLLDALDKLL